MRKISLIVLILFCWFSFCFAFTINDVQVDDKIPYRIYVGENWIDLRAEYKETTKGLILIFEDLSPIKEISIDEYYQIILVEKEKSLWQIYWSDNPENISVKLMIKFPEEVKKLNFKTIYKVLNNK